MTTVKKGNHEWFKETIIINEGEKKKSKLTIDMVGIL